LLAGAKLLAFVRYSSFSSSGPICMPDRISAQIRNPFLTADGVATGLAIRKLRSAGIDPLPLLEEAGVSPAKLAGKRERVAAESQLRFLENAAEALDSPSLGLQLAQQADMREAGVIYYVMAASLSLGEAMRNLARYLSVANESVIVILTEVATNTVLTFKSKLPRHTDRHFAEFGVALIIRGFREITGKHLNPAQVTFEHRRNAGASQVKRFFGCLVGFSAPADAVVFPTTVLATPIPTADNYLLNILREHCDRMLAERGAVSGTHRAIVENVLVRMFPHGDARIGTIASDMGLTSRTLSRRLKEEGTNFAEILDELRRDLATRHLKDHNLSFGQISWLLGYSEVSSFNHACKRWTGNTPKSIRAS
jgi:AraC-like DNA-binding protein